MAIITPITINLPAMPNRKDFSNENFGITGDRMFQEAVAAWERAAEKIADAIRQSGQTMGSQ